MKRADLKARAKSQLGGNIFGQSWMMPLLILLVSGLLLSIPYGIGILLAGTVSAGAAHAFLSV